MTSDSPRDQAHEIYGGNHNPDTGVPAYQYARITLTPVDTDSRDAPVIIHTTSSGVRTATAELLDDNVSRDVADGAELYTLESYADDKTTAAMNILADMITPLIDKTAALHGPPYRLGAGTLAAEPLSIDQGPAMRSLLDQIEKSSDKSEFSIAETDTSAWQYRVIRGLARAVIRPTTWRRSFTESTINHSGSFMLNPSPIPKTTRKPKSQRISEDIDALSRRASCDSADSLRILGQLDPDTAMALYTPSSKSAAWMALHLREQGYEMNVVTHAPADGVHYLKTDMVKPEIRRSHGDNDDAHTPVPVDYMSLL